MKIKLILSLLLVTVVGFSQNINHYKAILVPLKFDFMKSENQYRLATRTKYNLQKAGFTAFYSNETIPAEYSDRCNLLTVDVTKENGFLITKLLVVFKDCFGKLVYQSEMGKSKEKDYELAYTEALNDAFTSIMALNYKYETKETSAVKPIKVSPLENQVDLAPTSTVGVTQNTTTSAELLYAQATATGYQLVDASPKVIFKLNKTSVPTLYTASKGNLQGVLIQKENEWFFEYYVNEILVSEKVKVKF